MQDETERFADAHRELTGKMVLDAATFNREIVGYPIPAEPQLMEDDRAKFRADFMDEELKEFRSAQAERDLDGAVDAIIDLMYVAAGALNEMGVATQPCWDEVHRANMRKRRGSQTKRPGGKGFDAVKPEGWTAPSHADYLTITSEDVRTILEFRRAREVPSPVYTNAGVGIKANDDFEYVGVKDSLKWEHRLIGKDGYVFSVNDDGTADVKFYDRELPQRMTVSLREIRRKPKGRVRGSLPIAGVIAGPGFFDGAAADSDGPTVKRPRIMVMGYARHGKDTVSELLRDEYGMAFTSSSQFCAERVVFPHIQRAWARFNGASPTKVPKPQFPNYASAAECFEDRSNRRELWYDLITAFNTPDLTALGRAIYEDHDVYCGIRNAREFHALRNARVFDVAIWVDAFERTGHKEDETSCTVEPWMADYVLDNNGDLDALRLNLSRLMVTLSERGIV